MWKEFATFCQLQISEGALTSYEAAGFVDLLYHQGKHLVRLSHPHKPTVQDSNTATNANLDFAQPMIRQICDFLLVHAFFDCSHVSVKKSKSKLSWLLKMATTAASSPKPENSTSILPYDLRCVLSARFYSLVGEQVGADLHSGNIDNAVSFLQECLEDWNALVNAGAQPLGQKNNDDDNEETPVDENETPAQIITHLGNLALEKSKGSTQKVSNSFVTAARLLSSVLYLHLLSCGSREDDLSFDDEEDPDVDDDSDDKEEVEAFLRDILEVTEEFLALSTRDADDETNPLVDLAGLCIGILSSPIMMGNHLRGASPKLLRDTVRQYWIHGLQSAAKANIKADPEFLITLLDAMGASPLEDSSNDMADDDSDPSNSDNDDDESNNEDEQMDTTTDNGIFVKAASLGDVSVDDNLDAEGSESSDVQNEPDADTKEDEIQVDNSRLQSLLEEDEDASVDEGQLEHHAGADAALARLISMKQEARKAGQAAREKIELANQLRCTTLFEIMLMGRPDGWGTILSPGLVLAAISPLLDRRKSLEKGITKLPDKDSTLGDKRALLDRITSLLRQRVLKTKVSSLTWSLDADPKEFVHKTGMTLLKQAKDRNSKDHASLVGSSLVFIVKALPDTEKIDVVSELLGVSVQDWAGKQSAGLDERIFEDFIQQATIHVSQAALTKPLAEAALSGKTSFIKTEAFRLLALLFNPKLPWSTGPAQEHTPYQSERFSSDLNLDPAFTKFLEACVAAFSDSDMCMGKRVRQVFKTLGRALDFADASQYQPETSLLRKVKKGIMTLKKGEGTEGLKVDLEKIITRLDGADAGDSLTKTTTIVVADSSMDDVDNTKSDNQHGSKSKKNKKKKSKKKR
jgi:hypothetical protein